MACLQHNIHFGRTEMYEANPVNATDFRFLTSAKKEISLATEVYHQIFADKHGFISNLSVLDLLFHEGPNTIDYLINNVKLSDLH